MNSILKKHRPWTIQTPITNFFLPYISAKGGNTTHDIKYPKKNIEPYNPISKLDVQ
jgi:hypothetical protein